MPDLAPSSSSTFVGMRKIRNKLSLDSRSATDKLRPHNRHPHPRPRQIITSGKSISSNKFDNESGLNTTAMQYHSASGTSLCHERLCSDGVVDEERARQQARQATSEICNGNIGGKSYVLRQKQQQQQQDAIQVLMVRTRMKRYERGATAQLIRQTHQWPARLLLQVALVSLAAGCVLSLVAHQSSAPQSVARNSSNSKQSSQTARQVAAAAAAPGQLDTSKQHTVQLMRSANVELTRRSLQRLQRDASSPTSSDAASSVVVAAAGPGAGTVQATPPTCGYPGSPAHASVTFNTSHVVAGTAASYTCDNGYELLGPPRRICQANGTWSPVGIPFCVLNVGLGKAAMQSSTAGHGSAQKAVDGSTSPYFQASTCTMTDVENNPWWYVNLLEPYLVQIVRIDFGTACCANRQKATIAVRVGNNRPDLGTNPLCNRYHGFIEEGKPLFLPCTRPAPGAFVSIHLESPSGSSLSICETFIYTDHALSIEQCPSFRDQPLGSTATYNGKCYLFHNNQALNFDGARKYCESRGGTLVDETSPALQGFLSWELYRRHRNDQLMGQYWLGAVRDARNQQNWKWINGRDVQISFWNSLASQGNCSRFDGSKGWLWSDTDCQAQLNYICQYRPLSCGKPEKPTNSTLITKNIDNGTVIEYQCAPGNLLMGPKARNCLPTGFFSEFAPKCKYLDCQFPAQIANGDYRLLNGTTAYQSVVTYYCNEGYQLYGRSTLTCDVDERWNGPPPRCEPLLCPAPVAPSNGYVTVTSNITVPGTQATYDCRPGYELVGDRLLSCLQSGSWDNSFPYCKEKRQLSPHTLGSLSGNGQAAGASTPASILVGNSNGGAGTQPPSNGGSNRPSLAAGPKQQPTGSSIQFPSPTSNGVFSSNRVAPNGGTTSAPNSNGGSSSSSSLPASLNGLAGQFVTPAGASSGGQSTQVASSIAPSSPQTPVVSSNEIQVVAPNGASGQSSVAASEQQSRKPAQPSSLNSQFIQSPSPTSNPELHLQTPIIRPQQSPPPARGSQMGSQPSPISPPRQSTGQQQFAGTGGNKFSLAPPQVATSATTNSADSSPLATTNSISVHQPGSSSSSGQQHQFVQQQQQASSPPSSSPAQSTPFQLVSTTSGPMSASSFATSFGNANIGSSSTNGYSLGSSPSTPALSATEMPSSSSSGQPSVLASLGGSGSSSSFRAGIGGGGGGPGTHLHSHSLANAKYSLDGIIAVAIFGGFIFLGAIITILVIIVRRRKSSQSSSIDAQTISTYDSNGEHNGLYRNYQQAWENLRFSAPGSQPKSSGNGPPVPPPAGSGGGGPAMGMKNYASPAAVAMLHHHHHHHAHPIHSAATSAALGAGHHMSASSTTSSSSQSSSSLAVTGPAGSGGADPLLGPHHHSSSARHHQQQQQLVHARAVHGHHGHAHHHQSELLSHAHVYHQNVSDDEDEPQHEHEHEHEHDEDDEQGVISADEANYTNHHRHQLGASSVHRMHALAGGTRHHLTSGASYRQSHQQAHLNEGFRDSNELTINADTATLASALNGQTTAAAPHNQAARRRLYSTNSMSRSMAAANRRSLGNLAPGAASGDGNGSESNSTRSSRASPPSDDHSLDRLAYGNNWHNHNPNGAQ